MVKKGEKFVKEELRVGEIKDGEKELGVEKGKGEKEEMSNGGKGGWK
jgi:hypothetical protein